MGSGSLWCDGTLCVVLILHVLGLDRVEDGVGHLSHTCSESEWVANQFYLSCQLQHLELLENYAGYEETESRLGRL